MNKSTAQNKALHAKYNASSDALNKISNSSSSKMGIVSDAVRKTDAFKNASNDFNKAHKAVRSFNSSPEGKALIKERNKMSVVERQKMRRAGKI